MVKKECYSEYPMVRSSVLEEAACSSKNRKQVLTSAIQNMENVSAYLNASVEGQTNGKKVEYIWISSRESPCLYHEQNYSNSAYIFYSSKINSTHNEARLAS